MVVKKKNKKKKKQGTFRKSQKRRRGGVQTAAAKKKASNRLKEHKKIRATKPLLCDVCRRETPVDHILIDGVRMWMCGVCFTASSPEYLASEMERQTRTGLSSLATARG